MRQALIIVDLQEGFLNERNRWIIPNVQKLLREGGYAVVAESIFHAEAGSLWDTQVHWKFPLKPTVPEIAEFLPKEAVRIVKTTKSAFKGDQSLAIILAEQKIDEVHVVGIDTGDCVFATAQESFDLGFRTFVLEDCTESSVSEELREAPLTILRELAMVKKSFGTDAAV